MTREQRKQRRKRVMCGVVAVVAVALLCVSGCVATDGTAEAEGWTRFLLILGAWTLTDIVMRAAFWLDGVRR